MFEKIRKYRAVKQEKSNQITTIRRRLRSSLIKNFCDNNWRPVQCVISKPCAASSKVLPDSFLDNCLLTLHYWLPTATCSCAVEENIRQARKAASVQHTFFILEVILLHVIITWVAVIFHPNVFCQFLDSAIIMFKDSPRTFFYCPLFATTI